MQKQLLATILATCGLAVLAIGAQLSPPALVQPNDLSASLDNQLVAVSGKLQSKWQNENGWRFRICSDGCVVVIIDNPTAQELERKGAAIDAITVGQRVTVEGFARRTPAGWRLFARGPGGLHA
ncbi:MAG TPA: hypothetical protein VGQ00_02045 [Candidatus Norongarragalinales archaeon]|jgi:hypothetical protein|nr:hypothetical protein [Candidatus Norongarragalinales archaeon]